MFAFDDRRLASWRFGTMIVLLAACCFLGGASRQDVSSLLLLQPFAVICAGIFWFTSGAMRWRSVGPALLLLAALAAVMAAQLIPLPPELWTALPGHGQFESSAAAAGLEQPWRPISLTPDRTLGSLVSLSVPIAVLLGLASLSVEQTRRLLPYLIGATAISALLGLAQIAGGSQRVMYLFDISNFGSPVGLFSNRNHQALFLVIVWPMLALWASLPGKDGLMGAKRWIALAIAIFMMPLILATGSRAGLGFGIVAIVIAVFVWRQGRAAILGGMFGRLLLPLGLVSGLAVVFLTIFLSRDETIKRVFGFSFSDEVRFQVFPLLVGIVEDFFPVGSGFGSFDPLFRSYEPFEALQPLYLNHAHNDLLELAIEGGLPALLIAGSLIFLILRRLMSLRSAGSSRVSQAFAWVGATLLGILLLSSLVDYPLRTPLLAAMACIGWAWLSDHSQAAPSSRHGKASKELYDGELRA